MTTKTENNGTVALAALIAVLAFGTLATILRGWVLTYLWAWFVIPFGVQQIGTAWAIGLAGFVCLIAPGRINTDDNSEDRVAKLKRGLSQIIFIPIVALGVGWITHAIMVAA